MMFLADECFDARVVAGLQPDGHDVEVVSGGPADTTVLQKACLEGRILLTEDKDFGELVVRLGFAAPGIVLIRMVAATSLEKLARVQAVFTAHADRLAGSLTVIDEYKARIRSLS